MKKRIFIVSPSEMWSGIDNLYKVCTTKSKKSLFDIYAMDKYESVAGFDNDRAAIKYAKKLGSKRPTII